MKYRKKPVVIEAFQMTEERGDPRQGWPEWLLQANTKSYKEPGAFYRTNRGDVFVAVTLEGSMRVDWDDYVIRGVKGEIYPCKPDIFEETYSPVFDDTMEGSAMVCDAKDQLNERVRDLEAVIERYRVVAEFLGCDRSGSATWAGCHGCPERNGMLCGLDSLDERTYRGAADDKENDEDVEPDHRSLL